MKNERKPNPVQITQLFYLASPSCLTDPNRQASKNPTFRKEESKIVPTLFSLRQSSTNKKTFLFISRKKWIAQSMFQIFQGRLRDTEDIDISTFKPKDIVSHYAKSIREERNWPAEIFCTNPFTIQNITKGRDRTLIDFLQRDYKWQRKVNVVCSATSTDWAVSLRFLSIKKSIWLGSSRNVANYQHNQFKLQSLT